MCSVRPIEPRALPGYPRVLPLDTDVTLTLANGDWNYFVLDLDGVDLGPATATATATARTTTRDHRTSSSRCVRLNEMPSAALRETRRSSRRLRRIILTNRPLRRRHPEPRGQRSESFRYLEIPATAEEPTAIRER